MTTDLQEKLARVNELSAKLKRAKQPKKKRKPAKLAADDPCATERELRDAAYEVLTTGTSLRDALIEALAAANANVVVFQSNYDAAETNLANCESP